MRRALTLAAVLFCAFGVAPAVAHGGTVRLWHALRGAEQEVVEQILKERSGRGDGLTVEVLALPADAFATRLTHAIPHGNGPDLFIAPHEGIGQWVRNGFLQPADRPASLDEAAFVLPAAEAMRFQGGFWGVPLAGKSLALLHDGEGPPPPFDPRGARADEPDGRWALAYEAGNFYHHAAIFHALGGRLFDGDHPRLDSPEMVRSLHFARDLVREGWVPNESDSALVTTLWNDGRVAAIWNGPWFLGEARDPGRIRVAPLPAIEPGGPPLRPFLTVEALFTAHGAQATREDRLAIVEALAAHEGALRRAREAAQTPVLAALLGSPDLRSDPRLAAFADQAALAVPMPNHPAMSAVWEPANRAIRAVLRGEIEPEAAARRAQQELRRALAPPPAAADPRPYFVALGLALVALTLWMVRQPLRTRLDWRESRAAWTWVAPALLAMLLLVIVPFTVGAAVAFFAHHEGRFTFVGLSNFGRILFASDQGIWEPMSFWYTLVVTVAWTLANVVLHTIIGVSLALLLREPWVRLRTFWRVVLIIPWAVPNYITALVWKGLFHKELGAINAGLAWFGVEPISWFARFSTSFAANLCTNTWLGFPFMMVTTLGALQSIPREVEEAALVDGATEGQRLRHIVLPLLRPALLPSILLGSVWTFNMFNIIYLVSGGEPSGSTEILITEAYRWAFTRQAQYGYASAYALLIFGILVLWGRWSARWQDAT